MKKLKNAYLKAPALFSLLLCIAVVIGSFAVYLGIGLLPGRVRMFDITENKLYTLHDETVRFISSVGRDVEILLVSESGIPEYGAPEVLLRSYAETNRRIKLSVVSPEEMFAKYGTLTEGCAVIRSDARETVVYSSDYFDVSDEYFDISYEYYYYLTQQGYDFGTYADFMYSGYAEQLGLFDIVRYQSTLTNAIRYVVSDNVTTLYSVTDHKEMTLDVYLYPELRRSNTELIFGKLSEGIPEQADGVLINNPQVDITEADKAALAEYLSGGGRITLITSYNYIKELPLLLSVCEEYGLTTDGRLLCEDEEEYHYGSYVEATHPTVNGDAFGGYLTADGLKPLAMGGTGITITEKEGITSVSLLDTSDNAYGKLEKDEDEKESGDATASDAADQVVRKRYSVAAMAKRASDGSSLLWFPTFAFSDSMYDTFAERDNFPVFVAAIGVQYGYDKPIDIPAVSISTAPLDVPDAAFPVGMVIAIIIPCAIIAVGGVTVMKRKNSAYATADQSATEEE